MNSKNSILLDFLQIESDEAFLEAAYMYALDRPSDPSGKSVYLSYLRGGMTREDVLSDLEASPEGQRVALRRGRHRPIAVRSAVSVTSQVKVNPIISAVTHRPASVSELLLISGEEKFLRAAYQHVLHREVDPSGLENYLRKLAGRCSREQVVYELATSSEGREADSSLPGLTELVRVRLAAESVPDVNHVNDLLPLRREVFVCAAYQSVLHREVDPQGLALYKDLLLQGWSRSYVLSELVNSDEGRSVKPSLRGLKPLVKRYRKAQSRSLRGWYHRAVKGAESDLPQDRLLRAALLAGR